MALRKPTPAYLKANPINWSYMWTQTRSKDPITCRSCGTENLRWTWNFEEKRAILFHEIEGRHACQLQSKDIFPGWCTKCLRRDDLFWVRSEYTFELTENYGLPHACVQDENVLVVSYAKCKYCDTKDLFWFRTPSSRFQLVKLGGEKHVCPNRDVYLSDWKAALRENYAFEKKWLKSFPDDFSCKKCDGKGRITYLSNSKRLKVKYNATTPVEVSRPCKRCKTLGVFTKHQKYQYLKELRSKYWPWIAGRHKWEKHDNPERYYAKKGQKVEIVWPEDP